MATAEGEKGGNIYISKYLCCTPTYTPNSRADAAAPAACTATAAAACAAPETSRCQWVTPAPLHSTDAATNWTLAAPTHCCRPRTCKVDRDHCASVPAWRPADTHVRHMPHVPPQWRHVPAMWCAAWRPRWSHVFRRRSVSEREVRELKISCWYITCTIWYIKIDKNICTLDIHLHIYSRYILHSIQRWIERVI